jgi:hypothetical protein
VYFESINIITQQRLMPFLRGKALTCIGLGFLLCLMLNQQAYHHESLSEVWQQKSHIKWQITLDL